MPELHNKCCNPARNKIFEKPAPAGWIPAIGDYVYLPQVRRSLGNKINIARVIAVAGKWVKVAAIVGHHLCTEGYEITDIRPVPKPRKKRGYTYAD